MGYRIKYDSRIGKYEVTNEPKDKFPFMIIFIAVLFLAFLTFQNGGVGMIRSFLIPGEDSITIQAFRNMTDDLRSGASWSDAVYAFCRYIIHAA